MPTDEERLAALTALSDLSGFEVSLFDRLFPTRPFEDVVPSYLWYRPEVAEYWKPVVRAQLFQWYESQLGRKHAETLMAYLPYVPWEVLARYGVYPPLRGAA
jgi:hypothetical protein